MIDILLVDDHEMVRAGLRSLLAGQPAIRVVGEAGSVAEAVREAERLKPRVILMDLRLPDGSGIDACRDILSTAPQTKILFLTSYSDEEAIMSTIVAGASGYLMKEIGHEALIRAIEDAASGRPILDSRATAPVQSKMKNVAALSPQERRVLALIVEGKTNKEIAAALYLSDKTVKHYLSNACVKLGVTRRSQAAVLFAKHESK